MTVKSLFRGTFSLSIALLSAATLAACGSEGSPSNGEFGTEAADDEAGTTDGSSEGDSSTSAGTTVDPLDMLDTGASETTAGSNCPQPDAPAMLVDDPSVYCSAGFEYDATYQLCVSASEAIGPFPPAMVSACEECGGIDCGEARWPADQARGLRGTGECWPGTTPLATICVDEVNAWGPFSPSMVADCKSAGGGEVTCESMRWARDFAENLLPPELGLDWVWIMPIDLGLRDDASGGGAFSAPRANNPGGHSGIDVLASVGTPLFAPCAGPVQAGYDAGYGNWVQLACEIPTVIAGGESLWVSILFGHLDTLAVDGGEDLSAGQMVGTVGKTGNAAAAGINAHVHFEMAIHSSLAAAQSESHASSNHSSNAAGDLFAGLFASACLDELGFESTDGPTMKGRRPDPFMLLSCLSSDKPALEQPAPSLQASQTPWSDYYSALGFDVDVGL